MGERLAQPSQYFLSFIKVRPHQPRFRAGKSNMPPESPGASPALPAWGLVPGRDAILCILSARTLAPSQGTPLVWRHRRTRELKPATHSQAGAEDPRFWGYLNLPPPPASYVGDSHGLTEPDRVGWPRQLVDISLLSFRASGSGNI